VKIDTEFARKINENSELTFPRKRHLRVVFTNWEPKAGPTVNPLRHFVKLKISPAEQKATASGKRRQHGTRRMVKRLWRAFLLIDPQLLHDNTQPVCHAKADFSIG